MISIAMATYNGAQFLREQIDSILNQSMQDLLNTKLTASWEKGLDMVAKKEIPADEFYIKLISYINKKFDRLVVRR